jgi:hypothetical protein
MEYRKYGHNYGDLNDTLLPIYETNHVTAVFSGHTHYYERFERNGIKYIVTGGGGAPLNNQYPDDEVTEDWWEAGSKSYHYLRILKSTSTMNVTVIDRDGSTLDTFTLSPTK